MSDMNKVYELLEKVYIELQDTKSEVKENTKRLDKLESGQRKVETTLENDIKTNLQTLHERAEGNTSKSDEHSEKLNNIENKLDYLALSVNSQDKRLETVEVLRKTSIK
jgi:chromosome segregation ATPase